MPLIYLETQVNASAEICFDLSRSIDLHQVSTAKTQEKAVAGVVAGLIDLGDTVTWQAVHFGLRQKLASVITAFDRPTLFVDEMVAGAFKRFTHEHRFIVINPSTTLIAETFDYTSPLGPLGKLADLLFLKSYMTRLLSERNKVIKEIAESDQALTFIKAKKEVV